MHPGLFPWILLGIFQGYFQFNQVANMLKLTYDSNFKSIHTSIYTCYIYLYLLQNQEYITTETDKLTHR